MSSFPDWPNAAPNEIYTFLCAQQALVDAALADLSAAPSVGVLRRAALCLSEFFAVPERASHVADQLLQRLHDSMFSLVEREEREVASAISRVCELVWQQRARPHRERIVPQTIMVVMLDAISSAAAAAEGAKRALAVSDMLSVLDLAEESAASVRALLVQCVLCEPLLASGDGRRFLAYCLTLDESLTSELHDAVKVQLPKITAVGDARLAAFGEIYVRAWRLAAPAMRGVLERVCVQDLCSVAIYCGNATIVSAALGVLRHAHQERQRHQIDGMLLRAYEPLLFRSLTAANAQVRANAAALLADAFPLQDPDAPQAETDATLQSQLDALDALLSDPAVDVRVCAVRGAARWLSVFWEMLPREVHLALLRRLLKLSHDCTAPAVRAAVCDAFAFVLTQHLAHSLLAQALPKLEHLVDDRVASVRAALLGLMLEVKKVKSIKFYDTAAPDRLLARLTLDDSARTQAVVSELLLPTFFAHQKPSHQQAERALFLLHTQPLAAPKFFAGACAGAGSGAAARLIGYLARRLSRALQVGAVPADALGDDVQHLFINDYATVHALLRSVNAMWDVIRPSDAAAVVASKQRAGKAAAADEITALLREVWTDQLLCQLWLFFASRGAESTGAQTIFEPIAQIAARMPRGCVPDFYAVALAALDVPHPDVPKERGDATKCGALATLRTPAQLRALARCAATWGLAAPLVGAQLAHIAAFLGEERDDADESSLADDVTQPLQLLSAALVCHDALRDAALAHERASELLFTLLRRLWRADATSTELLSLSAAVCARHALHADLARASTAAADVPLLCALFLWVSERALRRRPELSEAQQSALAQLMCVAAEAGAAGLGVGGEPAAAAPAVGDEAPPLTTRDVPPVSATLAVHVLERMLARDGGAATIDSSVAARVCQQAAVKMSFAWASFGAYEPAQRVYDAVVQSRVAGEWRQVAAPDLLALLGSKRGTPADDAALSYFVQTLLDALASPAASSDDGSALAEALASVMAARSSAKSHARARKLWQHVAAAVRARLLDSDERIAWRAAAKSRLVDLCSMLLIDKHVKENADTQRLAVPLRATLGAFHDALDLAPDSPSGGDDEWRLHERVALRQLKRTVAQLI